MRDRRSTSPPSRRKREKDGAAPPIFVAKGWASPLSHHAGKGVTSVVNCCREVGVFSTAPSANGIRDVKVNDVMRLYLVLGVGGLINHAEHDSDELRIVAFLRNS